MCFQCGGHLYTDFHHCRIDLYSHPLSVPSLHTSSPASVDLMMTIILTGIRQTLSVAFVFYIGISLNIFHTLLEICSSFENNLFEYFCPLIDRMTGFGFGGRGNVFSYLYIQAIHLGHISIGQRFFSLSTDFLLTVVIVSCCMRTFLFMPPCFSILAIISWATVILLRKSLPCPDIEIFPFGFLQ